MTSNDLLKMCLAIFVNQEGFLERVEHIIEGIRERRREERREVREERRERKERRRAENRQRWRKLIEKLHVRSTTNETRYGEMRQEGNSLPPYNFEGACHNGWPLSKSIGQTS
jgi:hypothetical protein